MTLAFSPSFHERFAGFVAEADRLYGPDEADLPGILLQLDHLLRGWDLRSHLPRIDIPTLVLCGDRDPVVAPEDTAEIAELLPRAELVRIAGAAHSVLAEGGDSTLEKVVKFLDRGLNNRAPQRSYRLTAACSGPVFRPIRHPKNSSVAPS